MKKSLPRLFLAVMTALSLWGAARTMDVLPINCADYSLSVLRLDFVEETGQWRSRPSQQPLDASDEAALFARLQASPMRLSADRYVESPVQPKAGDTIFYCPMYCAADPAQRAEIRLYQVAGQQAGYLYTAYGACYALSDPAPLLEFLQERVPFPA